MLEIIEFLYIGSIPVPPQAAWFIKILTTAPYHHSEYFKMGAALVPL
jgi:hypothetical protein